MINFLQLVYINKLFNKFYFNKKNMFNTLIKKIALFKQRFKIKNKAIIAKKKKLEN